MKIFTIIVIGLFTINIIGYLYFKFLKVKGKYVEKRKDIPRLYYREQKLLGREYYNQFLKADKFEELVQLAKEYVKLDDEEKHKNYQEIGFETYQIMQNIPRLKNKFHFQRVHLRYKSEGIYRLDDDSLCYKPYFMVMFDEFIPQNYFISYLPNEQKIEILTHNIQTDNLDIKEQINIAKPLVNRQMIRKIEETFRTFFEFLTDEIAMLKEEKEKINAEKREKLFATTDVLQRAKALYDLLKIPQDDQEEIYKQIIDEDEILNLGLMDYDYILVDDIHWGEIDTLENRAFFAHYGVEKAFEKCLHYFDFDGWHHFYFISAVAKEILKYGKTLVNLRDFYLGVSKYVIIDSKDRVKISTIADKLKEHHEINGIVFFDEVGQNYPLPEENLFDQIGYKIKAQKNRTIADVRSDLIKLNDYLLGDSTTKNIDAKFPIFTPKNSIKVEWKLDDENYNIDTSFEIYISNKGISFVELCFALEQEVAKITNFTNDVFTIQSFELGYDNQPTFILELSSELSNE